jgi:hypothetical protein
VERGRSGAGRKTASARLLRGSGSPGKPPPGLPSGGGSLLGPGVPLAPPAASRPALRGLPPLAGLGGQKVRDRASRPSVIHTCPSTQKKRASVKAAPTSTAAAYGARVA